MATFQKRGGKWRAIVRRKNHPTVSKTFARKTDAQQWAARIESDIYEGALPSRKVVITLGDVLKCHYKHHVKPLKLVRWERAPSYMRELVRHFGPDTPIDKVVSIKGLEGYARYKISRGTKPVSVKVDISHLSSALTTASIHLGLPPEIRVGWKDAYTNLTRLRLVDSGSPREQRVSDDDIDRLCTYLEGRRFELPMRAIVEFAVSTAMRIGEICSITWADIDLDQGTVLIRNRKHPTRKQHNTQLVPLSANAVALLRGLERVDERVFPYNPKRVSQCFLKGRQALGLEHIRFHDLRHEGVSRLFERGLQIPEVSMVSGHKDWKNLKRYTNLRPSDLAKKL